MSDEQIKQIAERFLSWKLPDDFNPDGGISFEPLSNAGTDFERPREPIGTNLLTYTQAVAMVEHMIDGMAPAPACPFDEDDLEEIISDTLDMDWQPRWAARAIITAWNTRAKIGESND